MLCRQNIDVEAHEDESEEWEPFGEGGSVVTPGNLSFKPLFTISNWTERTTLPKRLSVAIILPADISSEDFIIIVVDCGSLLQLSVRCPMLMLGILVLHRWKLGVKDSGFMSYQASVLCSEAALRNLRQRSLDAL